MPVQAMDKTVFNADLSNIIAIAADGGSTFVWTSKAGAEETITCTRGDLSRTNENAMAGYFDDKELTAIMQVSSFVASTDLPEAGNSATLDGVSMRVERRAVSDDGVQLTVDLVRA